MINQTKLTIGSGDDGVLVIVCREGRDAMVLMFFSLFFKAKNENKK